MLFIETTLFSKKLKNYFNDDTYRELQNFLIERPDAGNIIQDTGGLRKLRWKLDDRGKRGGIRIIYYWHASEDQVYFFTPLCQKRGFRFIK